MRRAPEFPFLACASEPDVTRALLVCAVDPRILGVLVSGSMGCGKSQLIRSFLAFRSRELDPALRVQTLPAATKLAALVPRIDLAATLSAGRRVERPGLSADVFVIEDFDRLAPRPAARIAAAAAQVYASASESSQPDWIGLGVRLPSRAADAPTWLAHRLDADADPVASSSAWQAREAALARTVLRARKRLGAISVSDRSLQELHARASDLGVTSARACVQATRAALAHAALRGAPSVDAEDVAFAVRCALQPRARVQPEAPQSAPSAEAPSPSSGRTELKSEDALRPPAETEPDSAPDRSPPVPADRPRRTRGAARPGRSATSSASNERGHHVRAVPARRRAGRIAVAATLRAAAVRNALCRPRPPLRIAAGDLHVHEFRETLSTLAILVVDTSGSMAGGRLRAAQRAAVALLSDSYRRRDRVAIVTFGGDRAAVILPPTSSIARARSLVTALPAAGGTPLVRALLAALRIAQREAQQRAGSVRVLLWTDGHANVALDASLTGAAREARVVSELERVAQLWRRRELATVVLDTRLPFDTRDDARRLAALLGADYQARGPAQLAIAEGAAPRS